MSALSRKKKKHMTSLCCLICLEGEVHWIWEEKKKKKKEGKKRRKKVLKTNCATIKDIKNVDQILIDNKYLVISITDDLFPASKYLLGHANLRI